MVFSTKRVLHVISSAGFGGGERYLLDLVRFSSEGYRHIIVVPYAGPMTARMAVAGNDYSVIPLPRIPSFASMIRLFRVCRRKQVDIIHSHGYRANLYGRLLALLCRKPHVATVHVSLYDYLETAPVVRRFYRSVERWTSPLTRCFICISGAMSEDMRRLGISADRMVVIPNGVDAKRFCAGQNREGIKRKFGIHGRHPVIGTVGRLVREKGQAFLIEALAALKNAFPDLACLIVGEGPLLEYLKQEALAEGVSDICRFTGPIAEIKEVYAILDLFVLPSLREPFGLAVLEAMASGTAVLATDSGGPAEYIRPGVNGLLVPPGDPAAMAAKIRQLLSDHPLRKTLAEEGRRTVVERFDVRKTVKATETVYDMLQQQQS